MLIVKVSVIGGFMFKKTKKKMVDSPQILAEAKVLNMQYGSDNTPFFVLGCVRSGTTLLRDILKLHTRLESPEETHFFRWADPYASPRYERNYVGVKLFKNHQEIDGVSESEFHASRFFARNRRDISDFYGKFFLEAKNNVDGRWFDKTPQNVYGILLLGYMYPNAKFLHIYRNPLNVVSSLKEGRVMAKHEVKGGINYWLESMIMINEYKKIPGGKERFLEIKYEDLVSEPNPEVTKILEFINEDPALMNFEKISTHKEKDKYKKILTEPEISYVKKLCEPFYTQYGYK
ncbi:MAG: sulfotransferase [Cellvibrionales bacterium]|nr:sulfotransferase [Cellvibrionales bacterium]